jgi:hypothetical protein
LFDTEIQWQLISRDKDNLFDIIKGEETWLSTVKLTFLYNEYKYESCIFTKDGSEVLCRYKTKEQAIDGHYRLAEKYNLR